MNRQPYQTPPRWWAPKLSPRWVGVIRPLRRQRGLWMHGLTGIEVRGLDRLQASIDHGHGILIAPNHPTHADPFVMLEAADRLGRPFFFLTAWQVFAATHRLGRWVLRQHGCFSINREGTDFRAIRQAVRVLEAGEHPLVIFPEGEVFHLNDRVTPFRRGAGTIALRAAKRANRTIACIPCGVRFQYATDPTDKLSRVMDRLEAKLGWTPRREMQLARRLQRFADGLLCLQELDLFGSPQIGTFATRTERLMASVLGRLEDRYGMAPGGRTIPERVKQLRQCVIGKRELTNLDSAHLTQLDADMNQLFLVMQLFSYPADYLDRSASIEQLAETIDKLEEDVLGVRSARRRGSRRAIIEFGEPIVIEPNDQSTRKDAIRLTSDLEAGVQHLLDGTRVDRPTTRLPLPASNLPTPEPAFAV